MGRELTKREKTLLILFAVIILALGWFKLVYEPINLQVDKLVDKQQTEETEYLANLPKVKSLKDMQKKIEELRASGTSKQIPLYDNSKELMVELNRVLTDAENFELDFGKADNDDYIVFHTIQLEFETENYEKARAIIDRLSKETFTNQISDVNIVQNEASGEEFITLKGTSHSKMNYTTVSLVITFYEVSPTGGEGAKNAAKAAS